MPQQPTEGDPWKRSRSSSTRSIGLVWIAGWLFTIGFLKLGFWQGVFAIFIWPYYLGTWVAALPA